MTSTGGWWLQTAAAAGAVFTEANAGDAIIRCDTSAGRVLLGAGSNTAAALSVGQGFVRSPLVLAARFQDTSAGLSDVGASVSNLVALAAGLADGSGLLAGAVGARALGSNAVLAGHVAAGAIDPATKLSAPVPVAFGGTGLSSAPAGKLLVGAGAAAMSAPAALNYDSTSSNLSAPNLGAQNRVHAYGDLLVGAPGGVRYQLYVASDSNLKINRIDAAGASAAYLNFADLKALLAAAQVVP